MQQQAWSQCSSRHHIGPLVRSSTRCAATKVKPRSAASVKKERAPVPLPNAEAIEQANASDAIFTVRSLSEVPSGHASVHNSVGRASTAAAVVLLLLSDLNWHMSLPWGPRLCKHDHSIIYIVSVVCMYTCRILTG